MRIAELRLTSFRSYADLALIPGAGLNILYGENAQGKTNILEAISLLATTRSLRAGRESEMIQRGATAAHIAAEIDREREGEADIQVTVLEGDKKIVRVNGLKRPRVIDLLGQFNAVFFGSIDLAIVTGEPSDRRHYLNVEISQISPRYVYELAHYKRILSQRNRLLRDLRERPRHAEESGLSAWNEQLVLYGAPLFDRRRFYVDRIAPLADEIHRGLTDGRESLEVRYTPSIPLPDGAPAASEPPDSVREQSREDRYVAAAAADTEAPTAARSIGGPAAAIGDAFRSRLKEVALEEARRGTTLVGPQRDDLVFLIDGADARVYGSQGQQRTVALSLKLAEFRLIEEYVGEPPVMLLDDVMSDLDDARRSHLLAWIRRRCQTFLTCTNLRSFPEEMLAEAAIFRILQGAATRDEPERRAEPAGETRRAASEPQQADGGGSSAGAGSATSERAAARRRAASAGPSGQS